MARDSGITRKALDGEGTVGDHILRNLKEGVFFADACRGAGISPSTGHRWKGRGATALEELESVGSVPKGESVFAKFTEGAQTAQADTIMEAVSIIRGAAREGDWRAAAWFLERAYPSKWGKDSIGMEADFSPSQTITVEEARRHLESLPDTPLAALLTEEESEIEGKKAA